jgi:hypothetical protein
VNILAGATANPPDLVLISTDDDVGGVALAPGAECLDFLTDVIGLVIEH